MPHIIRCYTLFDITQSGVINRSKPSEDVDPVDWRYKRNTQCNFDTVLQAISLRSQPEVISKPKQVQIEEFENFGFMFISEENKKYPCWTFDFTVQHASVFDDGIERLGYLYNDCNNIPMVHCGTEWKKLPNFLDTSNELRNIYFEVINDE